MRGWRLEEAVSIYKRRNSMRGLTHGSNNLSL
jgi:hypothetical protein